MRLLTLTILAVSAHAYSPASHASIAARRAGALSHTATFPRMALLKTPTPQPGDRDTRLAKFERQAKPFVLPAIGYAGLGLTAIGAQQFVSMTSVGASTLFGLPMPTATLAAIVLPALLVLGEFALLGGGERVAKIMGGTPADASLTAMCVRVAERAGLPPPAHVYEIPSSELNAFAAGFGSADATVAVTTGIRRALSAKELEAVIAHEIGHIRHSDMRTSMHVAVAIAGLGGLYEMGRILLRTRTPSESDNDDDEKAGGELAQVGLALVIGGAAARLIAQLLQLSMSRGAEYDADRVAAELCGPAAMISALEKIDTAAATATSQRDRLAARGDTFAHAYISNGRGAARVTEATGLSGLWARLTRLFSTHPATHDRIEALRKYANADP